MDRRFYYLMFAGAAIAGLCVFKATRTYEHRGIAASSAGATPAPDIELYDQSSPSHIVRLVGYLGRNPVVIVFFDGRDGANHSPALAHLRDEYGRLRKSGVYVLAVSTALPQENRKIERARGAFPFPLLSDPDLRVHQAWGRANLPADAPREAVFLVDRKGEVSCHPDSGMPRPPDDWHGAVQTLIEGR